MTGPRTEGNRAGRLTPATQPCHTRGMDQERKDYADLDRAPVKLPAAWVLELAAAVLLLAAGLGFVLLANWLAI